MVSKENIFNIFRKFTLHVAPVTNEIKHFGQMSYEREGLLNKHICEKKFQISPIRQQKMSISAFPIISVWEI